MATPDDPEPTHRPILIVGSNGSGSTLLRLMLDSHERIAIPHETGFLRLAMANEWVPYWELGEKWHERVGLSDTERTRAVADFYGGLFASYAASLGKQRWGDKTPFHVWHMERAARLYPEGQVIAIIRHPGAVVSSLRRRFRRPIRRGITHWKRSTAQLIHGAVALGDQCVVIRYEDLVGNPEATMRALLEWLGEPWSDRVLAHHEIQPEGLVEGFTRTDTPINAAAATGWEKHLRGDAHRRMHLRTRDLAAIFGYDSSRALPLAPFSTDPSRPLVTGTELRELRDSRGAGINWDRTPQPRHEDLPLRPPVPRRGRRREPNLDTVTIRSLLQHRLIAFSHRRLSDSTRDRANAIRRSRPGLDRFLGPR